MTNSVQEFETLLADAAADFRKMKVVRPDGTESGLNFTYGDLITDEDENVVSRAAMLRVPEIRAEAEKYWDTEAIEGALAKWTEYNDQYVKPYTSRSAVQYGPESFPKYDEALETQASAEAQLQNRANQAKLPYASGVVAFDEVRKPAFYAEGEVVAGYGVDPMNQSDFSNVDGVLGDLALNSRSMTIKDFERVAKRNGLDGTLRYVNPKDPSAGYTYTDETGEEKIINSPFITTEDVEKFLVQEGPVILADIALTMAGTKKFTKAVIGAKFLSKEMIKKLNQVDPTFMRHVVNATGMGFMSATGAAGADFMRMLIGYGAGANEMDLVDMMQESLFIGALSFLGTGAVQSATIGIPALWRKFSGKEAPPSFFQKMDDLLNTARRQEEGLPTGQGGTGGDILYGDPTKVTEINQAIDELSDYVVDGISRWKPTISSLTGDIDAASLEAIFLKHAEDEGLITWYQALKENNREVITQMLKAINNKAGGTTTKATSATLGEGIRVLATEQLEKLDITAREVIENLQTMWKTQPATVDSAGVNLLRKVPPKEDLPFTGPEIRLKQIKDDYLVKPNENWTKTFETYSELVGGGGYIKTPTNVWKKAGARDANQLIKSLDTPEAAAAFKTTFGAEGSAIMKRFQMMGKKGFENPKFTVQELNNFRVILNDTIGSAGDNKQIIRYASGLMTGIKKQIKATIDDGAAVRMKKEGIPPSGRKGDYTQGQINRYRQDTSYGLDIDKAWRAQKDAIELANTEIFRTILEKQPEEVVPYILTTSTPGSSINTRVGKLVTVLKDQGPDELHQLRRSIAGHIQENIINNVDKSPAEVAKLYRKFMKEHKGTLNELFDKDGYKAFSFNPKLFKKNVVEVLDDYEVRQSAMKARFGLADNPDPNATDIIYSFLSGSKTKRQTGQMMDDMDDILGLVRGNKQMEEEMASITRRYITQEITQPTVKGLDNVVDFDPQAINKFLTEGFGPEDITGPTLTFDNFILPLLGKGGDDYVKNLKTWNGLIQRELGAEIGDEYVNRHMREYTQSSTEYLKKAIVPPLTQFGRRLNAFEKRMSEKGAAFIGEMLRDPGLFDQTLRAVQRRQSMQSFVRFLSSYGTVATADLGEELSLYDDQKLKQSDREKNLGETFFNIPERVLEINEDLLNLGTR
tara:strand:- start:314 stop:3766 length:3453 start_codon:yes stop_codon:yes gene_type:complete